MKRRAALANLSFGSANVLLTLVTGLLLVPWYLRHFNLATYGAWLASGGVIATVAVFESGLSSVLTRRLAVANGARDGHAFALLASSGLTLAVSIGAMVAILGLVLAPFVPAWVNGPPDQRENLTRAIQLASLAAGTSILFLSLGGIAQAWQQTVAPGVIGTFAYLTNVAVILIGLELGAGVAALGAGRLALGLTYIGGYLLYYSRHWRLKSLPIPAPSLGTAKELWRESRHLLMAQIANSAGTNMESFVTAAMVSPRAAATVNLTGRLVATMRMFLEHVGSSAFAGVTIARERLAREEFERVLVEFLTVAVALSGIALGFALAISPSLIPKWVGGEAFGGIGLMLLIGASDALGFRKGIMTWLMLAAGQTVAVSRIASVEALLRLIALVAGVYMLGMYGVPVAGIVASGVALTLLMRRAHDDLPLPVKVQRAAGRGAFVAAAGVGIAILLVMPTTTSWLVIGFQCAVIGGAVVLASLLADRPWRTAVRGNLAHLLKRDGTTPSPLAPS